MACTLCAEVIAYWAGLSTDLAIEHVLLRSMKTSGGLTRGRGMTETQRLVWLMPMPSCAKVNDAMQHLTAVMYHTRELHKETTKARQERDYKDTDALITFLSQIHPFIPDPSLRCITSEGVQEDDVNADKAKEVGGKILSSMVGKNVHNYSFRRKDQVVTLASKPAVRFVEAPSK